MRLDILRSTQQQKRFYKMTQGQTLSVSISASTSPAANSSPSFFFQDAMFPCAHGVLLNSGAPHKTPVRGFCEHAFKADFTTLPACQSHARDRGIEGPCNMAEMCTHRLIKA